MNANPEATKQLRRDTSWQVVNCLAIRRQAHESEVNTKRTTPPVYSPSYPLELLHPCIARFRFARRDNCCFTASIGLNFRNARNSGVGKLRNEIQHPAQ